MFCFLRSLSTQESNLETSRAQLCLYGSTFPTRTRLRNSEMLFLRLLNKSLYRHRLQLPANHRHTRDSEVLHPHLSFVVISSQPLHHGCILLHSSTKILRFFNYQFFDYVLVAVVESLSFFSSLDMSTRLGLFPRQGRATQMQHS